MPQAKSLISPLRQQVAVAEREPPLVEAALLRARDHVVAPRAALVPAVLEPLAAPVGEEPVRVGLVGGAEPDAGREPHVVLAVLACFRR